MKTWTGSIEACLASGEHDQGDMVLVEFDELFDLAEQIRILADSCSGCDRCTLAEGDPGEETQRSWIERRSNRPLHPLLGGKSPYSEFLPL